MLNVLFNLLKNALYFIQDARKGDITIWTESSESFNKLHFRDTGKGISSATLPYIFESFFTQTRHGTGIGLAFCRMVIKEMGGEVRCLSELGKYTHFIVELPIVRDAK